MPQGRQYRVLHALPLRAAAVEHLHAAGGQQRPAVKIQAPGIDALRRLLVAQTQDAVRLAGAHLLHEPDVRPVTLVVAQRADGVNEVGLLTGHVVRQKMALRGDRVQQHLPRQRRHRLQQLFAVRREGIVDEGGGKADALALSLLADNAVHRGAVQRVHGCGQLLHVRIAGRPAAQHRRQQCVGRCGRAVQSGDQVHCQAAGLEFPGGQIGQEHVLHDLPTIFIHDGTS